MTDVTPVVGTTGSSVEIIAAYATYIYQKEANNPFDDAAPTVLVNQARTQVWVTSTIGNASRKAAISYLVIYKTGEINDF